MRVVLENSTFCFFLYFTIGVGLGTVFYRSDFCLAGILRDFFLFKDSARLHHLVLTVGLTALLFVGIAEVDLRGYIVPVIFQPASLFGGVGGLVFGFGMVLAGGCVFSSLYRLGSGNLTYLLVAVGIVCGSLLYAELFTWLRDFDSALVPGTLKQFWFLGHRSLGITLVACLTLLTTVVLKRGQWLMGCPAVGYLQPLYAAMMIAGANALVFWVSGLPLGISTAYTKLGALFESLVIPAHIEQTSFFHHVSLEIVNAGVVLKGSAGPYWDFYAYTEGALLAGLVLGAFVNALMLREFHIHAFPPMRQGVMVFGGGILLGLGARLAQGCNIKHLLGGVPLLSSQSILFVVCMLVGIKLGTLVVPRLLVR